MDRSLSSLSSRIDRLETVSGQSGVEHVLENGARAQVKRKNLLTALHSAIFDNQPSIDGKILLNTARCDDNLIFELAQALKAGPKRNTSEVK